MSGVVEVVDSVDSDGQSVEEDPPTNKMKKVVTDILVHWYPVCVTCVGYVCVWGGGGGGRGVGVWGCVCDGVYGCKCACVHVHVHCTCTGMHVEVYMYNKTMQASIVICDFLSLLNFLLHRS